MTRNGDVVSALAEQGGTAGLLLPGISSRMRPQREAMVIDYPIEVRVRGEKFKFKLHCGTYHTPEHAKVARDCATYISADYVSEKYGYRFPEIPSLCKNLANWEHLCHDLRKVCTEGSSEVRRGGKTKHEYIWVNDDVRKLIDVVIQKVFPDEIPSSRAANGVGQPDSDVEIAVPFKQVTEALGTTPGHTKTPMGGHSQQYASRDVKVDDAVFVHEHPSDGKLSGNLNFCHEESPHAIAESVNGFTFEQRKEFVLYLSGVVKQDLRTLLLANDSSEAAVVIPHAAAHEVHVNVDESQRTNNVPTAGGRSQSPETSDEVAVYGRAVSTITSSEGRGMEWMTSSDLRTEPIRRQELIWYDKLDCPVDVSQDKCERNYEPTFHNVNHAENYCSSYPTSSPTVPTLKRPASRCPSIEEEETSRGLSQRQKPSAGDSNIEIVTDRTEEALQQEGSGDGLCNIPFDHDYVLFVNGLVFPTTFDQDLSSVPFFGGEAFGAWRA